MEAEAYGRTPPLHTAAAKGHVRGGAEDAGGCWGLSRSPRPHRRGHSELSVLSSCASHVQMPHTRDGEETLRERCDQAGLQMTA